MGSRGPDLQALYESLRAHAISQRQGAQLLEGASLLIRAGLPTWIVAWAQVVPPAATRPTARPEADVRGIPTGQADALVPVLAAMVRAGCHGRA